MEEWAIPKPSAKHSKDRMTAHLQRVCKRELRFSFTAENSSGSGANSHNTSEGASSEYSADSIPDQEEQSLSLSALGLRSSESSSSVEAPRAPSAEPYRNRPRYQTTTPSSPTTAPSEGSSQDPTCKMLCVFRSPSSAVRLTVQTQRTGGTSSGDCTINRSSNSIVHSVSWADHLEQEDWRNR